MPVAAQDILSTPYELSSRQFECALKRMADDLTYGSDLSRYVGPGIDYAQTRPYVPGDSVRAIDWKVTARAGRVFVKDYEAPKRVTAYIVVDTSASMHASSTAVSKHALAVWIAGTLAMVAFRRRCPVLLQSASLRPLPMVPTLQRSALYASIDLLRRPAVSREPTRLAAVTDQLSSIADRTGLFVFLTDLHEPGAAAAIARLGQRHDALVIHLQDPAESGRLGAGFVRAGEAEHDTEFLTWSRGTFTHSEEITPAQQLAQSRIDYVCLRTDQPIMAPLRRALSTRGGRRAAR